MNVRRFTARTAREALVLVREAFGEDAVVLSTKPCDEGVAVLAMAPEGMAQIERYEAPPAPRSAPKPPAATAARPARPAQPTAHGAAAGAAGTASALSAKARALFSAHRSPAAAGTPPAPTEADSSMAEDVDRLAMSTLSFQDYVRERMLRRREAEQKATAAAEARQHEEQATHSHLSVVMAQRMAPKAVAAAPAAAAAPVQPLRPRREPPVLRDEVRYAATAAPVALPAPPQPRPAPARAAAPVLSLADRAFDDHDDRPLPGSAPLRAESNDMMNELRSMKGLIEERFGALAFMEKLQRQPAQARLTQRLLDCGFSPALIRKMSESLSPEVVDETAWAVNVLERNLQTADAEPALEDQGGIYALVGATGVGKTTTTAKLAAAFATKYGAANLGLITLDAYRVGAHEQLRAYGRILGVTVHTAQDRASLEDLLDLLSAKKMVLIDTAGMAQRDSRTRELLDMMSHRSIRKLLVINAAAQGETIEDVLVAYRASQCHGIVLSKMDEAVKLGPALDALIRHRLTVVGVANGQRVPEDWHRLSAHALIHKAMRPAAASAYRLDANDVNIIFAAPHGANLPPGPAGLRSPAAGLHA